MKYSIILRLKNFEENFSKKQKKKRDSLGYRFRLGHSPLQDPRWFHKNRARFHVWKGSERKRGEKRFHARDLDEDQAWSDRWRCVCGIPWSSVNFTRLETVKPDPDHVEDAHPGIRGTWIPDRGHFYLSFEYEQGTSLENQRSPFFSIELWIPTRSMIVCFFFPSRFLFSFFFFYCNDCSFFLIYRMLFLCVTRENWRREISFQIFVLYWIIVMCCYKCEL